MTIPRMLARHYAPVAAVLTALSSAGCSASSSADPNANGSSFDDIPDASHEASVDAGPDVAKDAASQCEPAGNTSHCDSTWCSIGAGCFSMGSPSSEPGHVSPIEDQVQVRLTKDFAIQMKEVSLGDWQNAGFDSPVADIADGSACKAILCPVENINWYEALAYANKLNQDIGADACFQLDGCTGKPGQGMTCQSVSLLSDTLQNCNGFRLPTSAEWEYAARARTTTAFYSGDLVQGPDAGDFVAHMDSIGWYRGNAGTPAMPHAEGQKGTNYWGLYDMSGNVAEWVVDAFSATGSGSGPITDPGANPDLAASQGQLRGGSFLSPATECRSASRLAADRATRQRGFGLRLVQPSQK